jgi:hypothetical protein
MTIRATQGISSGFGTYRPGDPIDLEAAAAVIPAWLAAGIAEDVPEEEPVSETPKPEKATRSAPERATAPAQEPAQRRFVRDASGQAPQRRFVERSSSPRGS